MDELLSGIRESAAEQYDGYCDLEGSGWVFEYISGLYLEISGCRPLTGGCSSGEKFHSENIWDGDCGENECFFIAVARHFHDRSSATEEQIIDYAREWFSECLDLKRRATVHTCINCLNFFTYSKGLENHRKICQEHDAQRIEMPKQDSFVEFSKVAAIQKIPIIGAFDFETKMAPGRGETSKSKNLASHQVVSFSIVLLTMNNEIIYERYEQDEALCLSLFIDALRDINKVIADSIKNQVGIIITEAQEESHRSAQLCYICGKNYESDYKVKDHCHFTGIYFGASHNQCNLQRKQNFRVPVYAHNFSGYDSHFLLQAISQHKTPTDYISVLAYNSQRIRTLTYNKINFIDSMHFVSDSLGNITRDLTSSGHDFSILKKSGLFNSEEQLQLLLRKGVFPYELLTSLKKFRKMEAFPPRESFYSGLYEKHASPADYEHGKKVFETFKCQNMAQYLKLYNILDVYLLLEAITAFRNVGWTEFGLDAAHFISLRFFSYKSTFQYGFAQIQPLPTGKYRWATDEERREIILVLRGRKLQPEDVGFIAEVDFEYPNRLHDLHQDMPLAPEHVTITPDMVWRVLLFEQSPFMSKYISHLALLRANSKNPFEKSVLKKLANSCYGKMIENVRKYKQVVICHTQSHFLKTSSSPFFEAFKIYSDTLVLCFMKKPAIYMKSFHAIGLTILDYSKLHMYDLYYNHILPSTNLSPLNQSISIIMSDTDSFLFAIRGMTLDEFIRAIAHIMDFGNYPKNHPLYCTKVSGHLGFLKDETKGEWNIRGVIALKAKCYSLNLGNTASANKFKGLPNVARSKLTYKDYKQGLPNIELNEYSCNLGPANQDIVSCCLVCQ